jgi:hypothetical protein
MPLRGLKSSCLVYWFARTHSFVPFPAPAEPEHGLLAAKRLARLARELRPPEDETGEAHPQATLLGRITGMLKEIRPLTWLRPCGLWILCGEWAESPGRLWSPRWETRVSAALALEEVGQAIGDEQIALAFLGKHTPASGVSISIQTGSKPTYCAITSPRLWNYGESEQGICECGLLQALRVAAVRGRRWGCCHFRGWTWRACCRGGSRSSPRGGR